MSAYSATTGTAHDASSTSVTHGEVVAVRGGAQETEPVLAEPPRKL